jgi:hypothetical protein
MKLAKRDLLHMYPEIFGRPMKSITSLQEFVAWAKEVNLTAMSTKKWCDLQDIFAHSERKSLIGWYLSKEAQADSQLLLFAIYKNQGELPFMEFVRKQARQFAEEAIHQWEAEYDKEIAKREQSLKAWEDKVSKREAQLLNRDKFEPAWRKSAFKKIKDLRGNVEFYKTLYNGSEARIRELEAKLAIAETPKKPKRMISV